MKRYSVSSLLLAALLTMSVTAQPIENASKMLKGYSGKGGEDNGALTALKEAAKKGNAHAEYTLGMMYYHGRGVERSVLKAYQHFLLAGKKGMPIQDAQDFYFNREQACLSCVHLSTGKYSMTLLKLNGKIRVGSLRHFERAVTPAENIKHNRDITTFSGKEYKRLGQLIYTPTFQILTDEAGSRVTLPNTDIKYIFQSDTGELLFDAVAQAIAARQEQLTTEAYYNIIQQNLNSMHRDLDSITRPRQTIPQNFNCHYSGFGNINCIGF